MTPFEISVSDEKLQCIQDRVAAFNWFDAPASGDAAWAHGISTGFLKEMIAYWQTRYDWRACEADLNRFPHFKTEIDGQMVHFVHVIGEANGKRPLLLTHGWPGSIYEFWAAIGPLAFPSAHGGSVDDAFDLIIPSLPGYGFSGKPTDLIGPKGTAVLWDKLMREHLGYSRYLAQGGDWGAMVTSHLGLSHGAASGEGGCEAIHLNMIGFRPTPATPETPDEAAWVKRTRTAMQLEGAYYMQQATKPQTLAMALMDSPVGTAAWILEKFHAWSDLSERGVLDVYTRDQLLTNVMIYLVNDAIATSVWYYRAFMADGGPALPQGARCETPTGFANFPGEAVYTPPPRSWVERAYNLTTWQDMPRGGHFAAMEEPELFVEAVRGWARSHTV
ncbi:MAG: epoxide hydrolase family protein [Pseudomonadota bacterium]